MKDGLIITLLSIIPKKPTARFMGCTARLRLPSFINRALLRAFVWKYNINMDESESKLEDFACLSDLFLRKLKPGVRLIDQESAIATSPVDGKVHSFGHIENGTFSQSENLKGIVSNLIGSQENHHHFQNGSYMIIYLSPQDYHRVHSHTDGTLSSIRYLPGRLWPVFPAATRSIESLFDKNERMIFSFDTKYGKEVLAMIGAFGVGRMTSPYIDIVTNTNAQEQSLRAQEEVTKGNEVGAFGLGSTVILVWSHQNIQWNVEVGDIVRLGKKLLTYTSDDK